MVEFLKTESMNFLKCSLFCAGAICRLSKNLKVTKGKYAVRSHQIIKLVLINITINACTSFAERFPWSEPLEFWCVDPVAKLPSVIAITPPKAPSSSCGALDAWGHTKEKEMETPHGRYGRYGRPHVMI